MNGFLLVILTTMMMISPLWSISCGKNETLIAKDKCICMDGYDYGETGECDRCSKRAHVIPGQNWVYMCCGIGDERDQLISLPISMKYEMFDKCVTPGTNKIDCACRSKQTSNRHNPDSIGIILASLSDKNKVVIRQQQEDDNGCTSTTGIVLLIVISSLVGLLICSGVMYLIWSYNTPVSTMRSSRVLRSRPRF